MTDIIIRDFDTDLHEQLLRRADARGRSLEEEARETLRAALEGSGDTLVTIARRAFGPLELDLDLPPRSEEIERPPPDFSGPEYDH